ncbi:GCN5-related N-acetyltransferase [Desulfarculus baarsii DSM 2075]|uniref:GCN5-related N-acetyltransferase n=1 Tax=Desulfarculus baarsii (strain ATCC 33931 / DSM 2075 / LMG 7858 / VKM B-1802 / 2st14) TaxID=644282 RepID=E1QMH7_DESB2|nr:GNAT family N-acetyltransferase [Desulfarculus baarsii]ADK86220.1 GCN5-related N-acetyltransferase [Desulfarculus baarsii DSM 2075]
MRAVDQAWFAIRPLDPADAQAVCRVHHAAVAALANDGLHTPAQLSLWAAGMRPEVITQRLPAEGARGLVAQAAGEVIGFGVLLEAEIRALYVDVRWQGRGAGRGLLLALEALIAEAGHTRLTLNSSLNARRFYQAMGYNALREAVFPLGENEAMRCVVMEKRLREQPLSAL